MGFFPATKRLACIEALVVIAAGEGSGNDTPLKACWNSAKANASTVCPLKWISARFVPALPPSGLRID